MIGLPTGTKVWLAAGTIREAACWAYARREFHDLHAARATPLTTETLLRITELCLIETDIRGNRPTNESRFGKPALARCSTAWKAGCVPRSIRCHASPTRRRRFFTR
jgi:hypothetical protein